MTINGRRKGARAEIKVAGLLERWWGVIEPGCVFKRTPQSGGWARPDARADFKTSGDLVTTAERFPFTVECKAREGWDWENFHVGRASPVWGWWKQAQTQADEQGMGGEPMLWIKHAYEPWVVLVREAWVMGLPPATVTLLATTCHQHAWARWDTPNRGAPAMAYYAVDLLRMNPAQFARAPATKGLRRSA